MFKITTEWEALDIGSAEEKAAFARLGIQAQGICLTEGQDQLAECIKKQPLLSAYHLAEWFAWNWWRLRYETKPKNTSDLDWHQAHNTTAIGEGYIWPNLTFLSDGFRLALMSKPSDEKSVYRYLNSTSFIIPAHAWEVEVDDFISRVLARLDAKNVSNSNLQVVWLSVQEERNTPELVKYRKLEALLGYEPDEAPSELINELIDKQKIWGEEAVNELAASGFEKAFLNNQHLKNLGSESCLASRVSIENLPNISLNQEAWQVGSNLAKNLRQQLGNPEEPITSDQLAELMAVDPQILTGSNLKPMQLGYALKVTNHQGRVNLSGKRVTGRRFDLARLLVDTLLFKDDSLTLAASSSTYRQKLQRAFAAELLCPVDVLQAELNSDFSQEKQEDLADYFLVSPLTIKNILADQGLVERNNYFSNISA